MTTGRATLVLVITLGAAALLTACDSDGDGTATDTSADATETTLTDTGTDARVDDRFPDIVGVVAERGVTSSSWTFRVTVSSPYDTPERYADGWRVVGPDGTVYGQHTLLHDHANEQPFTRTQSGVIIPDGIDEVTIEGRDRANGYGGATVTVTLDRD